MPLRRPEYTLNSAHDGLLATENLSLFAGVSGSLTVGLNVYHEPTFAVVAGVPDIFGGLCA